jgi:tetratricopeptide (TPR) repeat protein
MILRQGDVRRAEEQFRRGHQAALARVRHNPSDTQAQRQLALSYGNLADLNVARGNAAAARTDYEQAVTKLKRAGISGDAVISRMLTRLGFVCIELRDLDCALECLDQAYELRKDGVAENPGDARLARDLWEVTLYRGDAKLTAADLPGAIRDYREAIRLAEGRLNDETFGYLGPDDAATSYERLATALLGEFDIEQAKQFYERALAIRQQLAVQNPTNAEHQRALAGLHDRLGSMWLGVQNADLAHERFNTALDIRQKLAAAQPDNNQVQIEILSSYGYLARAEEGCGNFDEAIRWYDKGLDLWAALNDEGQLEGQPRLTDVRVLFETQRGRSDLKRRAADDWQSVLGEYPELTIELLQARAYLLAKRGDLDQAQTTVEQLADLPNAQPAALDYAAYAFARLAQIVAQTPAGSAQDLNAKKAHFADKAMAMLHRAHAAGAYQKPGAASYLRYSSAYDELRSRPDFQTLLDQVPSGSAAARSE